MQLSSAFGGLPDLRFTGTAPGQLVRMVPADQAAIGLLDPVAFRIGIYPQQAQRSRIGHDATGRAHFAWFIFQRHGLHLAPAKPQLLPPVQQQFPLMIPGLAVSPGHTPARPQRALGRMWLQANAT
ncbi:hypothetical protein D3C81_1232720 [compost metagenome]